MMRPDLDTLDAITELRRVFGRVVILITYDTDAAGLYRERSNRIDQRHEQTGRRASGARRRAARGE
jgi:hypothetical protein